MTETEQAAIVKAAVADRQALDDLRIMLCLPPGAKLSYVAFAVSALLSRVDNAELALDMVRIELAILQKPNGKAKP